MAKIKIHTLLGRLFQPKKPPQTNWIIVLFAFLLSVILWSLATLNREYLTTFSVPTKIVDIPDNVHLLKEDHPTIILEARGIGGDLLGEYLRLRNDTLPLSFAYRRQGEVLITREFLSNFRQYVSKKITLQGVSPDSIFIPHELRTHKKVLLQSRLRITPQISYQIDELAIDRPDSVTLVGPQSMLDTIHEWYTVEQELFPSNKPKLYQVQIDTLAGLKVSPKEAFIYLRPRQYTQKILNLHLNIIDTPENMGVNLNPSVVRLSCLVPMESYDQVRNNYDMDIRYEDLDQQLPYFLPEVSASLPEDVKVVWRHPLQVSYVIIEKSR